MWLSYMNISCSGLLWTSAAANRKKATGALKDGGLTLMAVYVLLSSFSSYPLRAFTEMRVRSKMGKVDTFRLERVCFW